MLSRMQLKVGVYDDVIQGRAELGRGFDSRSRRLSPLEVRYKVRYSGFIEINSTAVSMGYEILVEVPAAAMNTAPKKTTTVQVLLTLLSRNKLRSLCQEQRNTQYLN